MNVGEDREVFTSVYVPVFGVGSCKVKCMDGCFCTKCTGRTKVDDDNPMFLNCLDSSVL